MQTLSCLKSWSCSLVVFFLCAQGAWASGSSVSLREVLDLGLKQGVGASRIENAATQIKLKEQQLASKWLSHKISSNLSNTRNEVGDSRDLDSTASETLQSNLTYEQSFENGFSWKANNVQRTEVPINNDDAETQHFQKTSINASYPVYGSAASTSTLKREKQELSIEFERSSLTFNKLALQTHIIEAFLQWLQRYEQYEQVRLKYNTSVEMLEQKRATASQLSAVELQQLQLVAQQLEQQYLLAEEQQNYAKQSLELLLEASLESRVPYLGELPLLQLGELEQWLQYYQDYSKDLQKLQQQLQQKYKDINLKGLSERPDVSVGGNIGSSKSNSNTGSNAGVYIAVNYRFGGSTDADLALLHHEAKQLELSIQETSSKLVIDAEMDLKQLDAKLYLVELQEQSYRISQQQHKIAELQFDSGEVNIEHVSSSHQRMVDSHYQLQQSKIQYWQHLSQVLQKAGLFFSEIAQTSSASFD